MCIVSPTTNPNSGAIILQAQIRVGIQADLRAGYVCATKHHPATHLAKCTLPLIADRRSLAELSWRLLVDPFPSLKTPIEESSAPRAAARGRARAGFDSVDSFPQSSGDQIDRRGNTL